MTISLTQASETGKLLDDVRRCSVLQRAQTQAATFRALGQCACRQRVPILITVRVGSVFSILRAAVCAERCPDCGIPLTPDSVAYLGVTGPGWPFVPATAFGAWEVGPVTANGKPAPVNPRARRSQDNKEPA